jgi:hypothetical protein
VSAHRLPARVSRALEASRGDFLACTRPDKIAYLSRAEARAAMKKINRAFGDDMDVYRCAGGHYHLGHKVGAP